ncbi:hypothetical protein DPEC_G00333890 [Dallia pectoralis]|uniref:Uncharacterized protein n=1 Tax=Dallia pectoralis TaxID=75939 RepID=A0ACC2F6V7_DALPE|nr:hypothetical protein DPEC_G00333890 [Dallia pectoralis]
MASFAACIKWTGRSSLYVCCCALVLFGCLCVGSPAHGRRLVCWQAIMKCHGEPTCHYAYDQYLYACAPVINGEQKKCPSHCIASLVQLNLTETGPSLEDCDCASDPVCRSTKRAIEPCLPRTSSVGCTEARLQCERNPRCSASMREYMYHCRKLFGGERCSDDCRRVISNMRDIPKAQQLDTCECDGRERTICEYVKVSMKNFCFDSAGSGESDPEEPDSEDEYDEPDYYQYVDSSSGPSRSPYQSVWTATGATILVLVHLIC